MFIGGGRVSAFEEFGHGGLPALVDFLGGHAAQDGVEILSFEVADKEAVGGKEEGIVSPPGLAESLDHFGPDVGVALAVFVE